MRGILFRAKRQDSGEWIEGFLSYGNIIKTVRKCYDWRGDYVCDSLEEYKVDKETVGQFTGLTDKNGKKILEGDIVKVIYTEKRQYQGVSYDDERSYVEEVIYNEQNACFMIKLMCEDIPMYRPLHNFENLAMIKEIEVVGNVFDNPELLESE